MTQEEKREQTILQVADFLRYNPFTIEFKVKGKPACIKIIYEEAQEEMGYMTKESEDEKARRELIKLLQECYDIDSGFFTRYCKVPFAQMLAWLKKQGQTFTKKDVDDAYLRGVCDAKHELEKQCEQKSADKASLDFKKGDILYEQKTMSILLVYERNGSWLMTFCDYWMLKEKLHIEFPYEKYGFVREMSLVPATKEQRSLLFQKMKEAGYEWDTNKKELKKIEQKPTEWSLPYGKNETTEKLIALAECLEMDGDCLFNGLSGNDYGKLLRALAIELTEVKPAKWSEEDENIRQWIISDIGKLLALKKKSFIIADKEINWLKSLKDRVGCEVNCTTTWKPSDEQMKQLGWIAKQNEYNMIGQELLSLYQDLKKLMEE